MNFTYINKPIFLVLLLFVISCQDRLISYDKKIKQETLNTDNIEIKEKVDFSYTSFKEDNIIDYYTGQSIDINFLVKDLNKIKINNYEGKINNQIHLNVIYINSEIYSINSKGEILKFDSYSNKLVSRNVINLEIKNKNPVSFSLIDNDFIIGFKSGEIVRADNTGKIKWIYNKNDLLNTPIKYYENNLIVLYSEDLIILSPDNGNTIFKKNYKSNNIIQSIGGKIANYFNIIFFLLPNSQFSAIDTLLYEKHNTKLDNLEFNNSLNNLKDIIHIYKNFLVYIDNGNKIYTYDLIKNNFILKNFEIDNSNSNILFNNTLISTKDNNIKFYNIKNGKLFSNITTEKYLKKDENIIKVIPINNKLHLFSNHGKLIILDSNLNIEHKLDLKIRNINNIYSYADKLFISTKKGFTHIF